MAAGKHFETELIGDATVIRVMPESLVWLRGLVDENGKEFAEELSGLMTAAPGAVVLDLGNAPFLNSDGIAALIRLNHQQHTRGAKFGVRAGGEIARVFEITKIYKLFPCGSDLPTVVAQVSGTEAK